MFHALCNFQRKSKKIRILVVFCMIVGLMGSVIDAALGLDAAIGGNAYLLH